MPPRISERSETSERVFCKSVRETIFRPRRPRPLECSSPPRMPTHAAPHVCLKIQF